MKELIEVPIRDFNIMLLSTFRYSLGSKTYMPGLTREYLEKWWDVIPEGFRKQIHSDITHAIENGLAGHECDIKEWKKVLSLPIEL